MDRGERLPVMPFSRRLVPYAFGAAVLCTATAVACVPPRGIAFDVLRYGGMLLAILAFAGIASSLWKAAQAAERFAIRRGYDGVAAVLTLNGEFWWLGLATGVLAYIGFVVAQFNSHWFGAELGVALGSLGPLLYCGVWSLSAWRLGPGSPVAELALVESPSPHDIAAQALIERAHAAAQVPQLQRRHVPLIVAVCAATWAAAISCVFVVPLGRSSIVGTFLIVPALLGTIELWRIWNESLGQREYWSDGQELVYSGTYEVLRISRTLAVTGSIAAYVLWFWDSPAYRIAGVVLAVTCACYWIGMPAYLLRRFEMVDADG